MIITEARPYLPPHLMFRMACWATQVDEETERESLGLPCAALAAQNAEEATQILAAICRYMADNA